MPLPKRPERSAPIPNDPFESPEVTSIKGPYWDMALGSGLEPDGQGSVQTTGSTPSEPSAMLYGPGGFVGLGSGLQIGAEGDLQVFGCDLPPYGCNTDVNPYCVTDFSDAWRNCTSLTSFPLINTSQGTNFFCAWSGCNSLTSFPILDVSNGVDFSAAWTSTGIVTFPPLDFSSATNFTTTWANCVSLVTVSPINFSNGTNFLATWGSCSNLTNFPPNAFDACTATIFSNTWFNCALSQTSVDNILISINTAGQSNGTLTLNGGTSSAPGPVGLAAKAALQARGWTVITN